MSTKTIAIPRHKNSHAIGTEKEFIVRSSSIQTLPIFVVELQP